MTRHPGGIRRGITLTEILISILIMGVGLLSLATLFPLGMVRLRAANQQHRSALLAESATADLITRGLLNSPSFQVVGALPPAGGYYSANGGYNPLVFDPQSPASPVAGKGVSSFRAGLPFCYDPLWWSLTGYAPTASIATIGEVRFGQAVFTTPASNSFIRSGSGDGSNPSGYGLQRLTNFKPVAGWAYFDPTRVFVSPDDPVMQNSDATPAILSTPGGATNSDLSGVVPNLASSSPGPSQDWAIRDFRYTWLFTGNAIDAINLTAFIGNVVVMDSRPFALDQVVSPTTGTASPTAAGEIVMEAAFGYSAHVDSSISASLGHGIAADRTVLLRWPATMPDPEIKVGSWIADVTYQRFATASTPHGQRCHWYQVARKGDVQAGIAFTNDSGAYRQMVVTTTTPVKERTVLIQGGKGEPYNTNVALFMPSVVNVYQRAINIRP